MRPPNWCWRQSSRIAGVSGPVKPTIMTAPISCWSVMPAGPRSASWLLLPAAGDAAGEVVNSSVGLGVTEAEVAATRDPQPANTSTNNRAIARRMQRAVYNPHPALPQRGREIKGVTRHRINFQTPKGTEEDRYCFGS